MLRGGEAATGSNNPGLITHGLDAQGAAAVPRNVFRLKPRKSPSCRASQMCRNDFSDVVREPRQFVFANRVDRWVYRLP
jgi:hypothetical protein